MTECLVCGQNNVKLGFVFRHYEVWICNHCGFQWLQPQPNDEELAKIYSEDYFLADKNDSETVYALKRSTAHLYLDQLLKIAHSKKDEIHPKSLLEIGCGMGDFLIEAQANGFKVSGLEVTDYLVQLANQRLGSECVEKGSIETSNYETGAFDIIVFFDVIEHVRNPELFLSKVNELLKASGKVYIVTPSLDSWSARLMGKYWMEYKVEHLSYFNQASLRNLLKKTGFHNIMFFPNYKILNIDYIYRHFVRFHVKGLTPLLSVVRKLTPHKLAYMPIRLIASGVAVIAEK